MDIFSAFYDFLSKSRVFSGLPANLPAAGTKIGAVLRRNGFANITDLTELILKPNMDPNEVLAAMQEEKPEFGKRDYIRVMREAGVIKQSMVRRFLATSSFGRRRIASSLSTEEAKEILQKFYKEYDFIYDSEVEGGYVAGTGDAIRLFDDLFDHSQKFKDFVRELVAARGDFFSSDRELAALMFVLNDDYPELLDSFERSVRSARESTPKGGSRMKFVNSAIEDKDKARVVDDLTDMVEQATGSLDVSVEFDPYRPNDLFDVKIPSTILLPTVTVERRFRDYFRDNFGLNLNLIDYRGIGRNRSQFTFKLENEPLRNGVSRDRGRMRPLRSDAESEQKLKEDLIRQGYTEAEAADIIARRKPEQ